MICIFHRYTVGKVSEKVWTAMSDLTKSVVDVSRRSYDRVPYRIHRYHFSVSICKDLSVSSAHLILSTILYSSAAHDLI